MKKTLAVLLALMTVLTLGLTAVAEQPAAPAETDAPAFTGGVQFNMDMEQVMQLISQPHHEIDREHHKDIEFYELEYKRMDVGNGFTADVTFSFVGNGLVAIHFDMKKPADYNTVKETLASQYGKVVPFDRAKIGNARYVVGDLEDCREMIEAEGFIIVLERDDDDVEVTILDPTAAYVNN